MLAFKGDVNFARSPPCVGFVGRPCTTSCRSDRREHAGEDRDDREPGKAEVAAEVIRNALFVCDDRELAVEMGAVGGVGLGVDAIAAELGEVLAGLHPGRTSSEQVTVYGGVGLAFQDLVAAWTIYETARLRGVGKEIDFIA